jgi:hypothetical protein
VVKKRAVRLLLSCAAARGGCRLKIHLFSFERLKGRRFLGVVSSRRHRNRGRVRVKTVAVGGAVATVPQGRAGWVSVPFNRLGLVLLLNFHKLQLLVAVEGEAGGQRTVVKRRVVAAVPRHSGALPLRPPRRR